MYLTDIEILAYRTLAKLSHWETLKQMKYIHISFPLKKISQIFQCYYKDISSEPKEKVYTLHDPLTQSA